MKSNRMKSNRMKSYRMTKILPTVSFLTGLLLTGFTLVTPVSAQENNILLPELGDSASGVASHDQEYILGRAWLRLFRNQVPEDNDPLMFDYLSHLLKLLADNSRLTDKRLDLIIVQNPTINAFAVPGGVVGVHNGLLLYADTEQELAGVLAHELAHLSQRHFVRSVEQARQNTVPTLAGMLAGLVLMGAGSGDAGLAAIMATQAANLESRLRFSRENEAEADRVGMQTLVQADMDPNALPEMFERMQRSMRYMGDRPPEFLLSHPVTEKRIADSQSRADQYPKGHYKEDVEYQLMRSRARLALAENPSVAARYFRNELQGQNNFPDANVYGITIAQIAQRQYAEANKTLEPLYSKAPTVLAYIIAKADILIGLGDYAKAEKILTDHLQTDPKNYPANMTYARLLNTQEHYEKAIKRIEKLLPEYTNQPAVWYLLAETRGLAGDIGGVHMARAEYYILNGQFDEARKQLTYAVKLYQNDYFQGAKAKQRLRELSEIEEAAKNI
jgi:predicted Zn-dependent protease